MPSGETILKLTDYPFSYSILGIISGVLGFGIIENQLVFLGIAGAFGTFLTIVDPMGWILRRNAEDRIKKGLDHPKNSPQTLEIEYKISALKSKSINFEIEKIIGLFYFILILLAFLIGIGFSDTFFEKLVIQDSEGASIFHPPYFKGIYFVFTLLALVALIVKANKFWKDLDSKIIIAGYHQIAINNDNATQSSVESMTRSVEHNDWELAKIWQGKIQEEIKYKKGKREIIIKSAEVIFRPLHIESISIESALSQIPKIRKYTTIPVTHWKNITVESAHVMIENPQLRKEITIFYDKIYKYNQLAKKVNNTSQIEILKEASKVFGKDITKISYWIISNKIEHVSPDLLSCILFNIHPLQTDRDAKPLQIDLKIIDEHKGTQKDIKILSDDTEFLKFELFWDNIIKTVDSKGDLTELSKLRTELKIENSNLQNKYQDMIELQWKV